jgi:D-glycero-D-manno-heptose 1,7-bisphosphate phosphatase
MSESSGNAAIFFDLGGTLVALDESRELPVDERGKIVIEILPGVAEKLAPIRDHLIFVVTNQSKIKRGRFTHGQVEAAIGELDRRLGEILTAWQICPHDDADQCACRKPKAGMVDELAAVYGVDLAASTMVGDQAIDEQTAHAGKVGRFIYAAEYFGWK